MSEAIETDGPLSPPAALARGRLGLAPLGAAAPRPASVGGLGALDQHAASAPALKLPPAGRAGGRPATVEGGGVRLAAVQRKAKGGAIGGTGRGGLPERTGSLWE